jgi:hypothetical protein
MTVQVPDYLELGGKRLCVYFRSHLPDNHVGISAATADKIAMLAVPTWNRRGYIGTWQFVDKRLQLVRLEGIYIKRSKPPLFAFWITDTLRVPMGELLCGVSLAHLHVPLRAQELRLWVDGGCLTQAALVDYAATCPPTLLAKFRHEQASWRRLIKDEPEPVVALAKIEEGLGRIEQSSPPAKWWEQEFPSTSRRMS